MYKINFNLLFICFSFLFEFVYHYLINKNVIIDFNRFIKSKMIRKIQLITIIFLSVTIIQTIFNRDYLDVYLFAIDLNKYFKIDIKIPYVLYLPFILILINMVNTHSTAVLNSGIRLRKVKNGLISWGQIDSVKFKDDYENAKCVLSINYLDREINEYEDKLLEFNLNKKYEIESTFDFMSNKFKQDDDLPFKYYFIIKKIFLGLLFLIYIILLLTTGIFSL